MDVITILRAVARRSLLGFIVVLSLLATPAFPVEYQDSQIFISGFNSYQSKNYQGAIDNMSQVLQKYPDSPLRDMAIFWLARANYKAGHRKEAAQYMAQFYKEYPNSPLKNTVEPELAKLAAAYAKGEPLPAGAEPAEEKVVTASAEDAGVAAEKADSERLAAEKAFADKAESEKLAAAKTGSMPTEAEKDAAEEKAATETAWQERVAAEKAASEKASDRKNAAEKAALEKVASEKAAARKSAAAKAGLGKAAKVMRPEPAVSPRKAQNAAAMREKAIAAYKAVINKYPGSRAAAVASSKLKELGIASPARVLGAVPPSGANAQIMTLEVEQFADCALNMLSSGQAYPLGKRFSIPFELVNQGNGLDSFSLESGFPPEFEIRFASSAAPETNINVTPQLVPGETFNGLVTGMIPGNSIDGQQAAFPIKATSLFAQDVSQSREIALMASAPLLRAVINPDKGTVLPGDTVVYHIALLNAGSSDAGNVTLSLDYSPHYEPVDLASSGFHQGPKGALVIEGQKINTGESKDYTVVFDVKEGAPARQDLALRANVINAELNIRESFLSAATVVQEISGVSARANTERAIVIPGQTITIPVVITNTGNIREAFRIRSDVPAGLTCRYFLDKERNGRRAPDATPVTLIGPLEPREEAYLMMVLTTPQSAQDASEILVNTTVESENNKGPTGAVTVSLRFARPIIELSMSGKGGKLKPAEISSFDFTVVNRGSNLAKAVEIRSILPDNLEILAADVPFVPAGNGEYLWNFAELGAGEKRLVKVSFRVKTGIPVGTNIQIKNIVTYEDQLGNRY